jgi:hypothetical protein
MFARLVLICPWLVSGSLWDGVAGGSLSFKQFGTCASGNPAYFGVYVPEKLIYPDALWVEFMGGAICFNHASCTMKNLGMWTDIDLFLDRYMRANKFQKTFFKSGASVPAAMLADAGLFTPLTEDHPFYGRRGLFLPQCTADIFIGHHNATYDPEPETIHHNTACNEASTGTRADYRGCQNITLSGIPCQMWSSQFPHSHSYAMDPNGNGVGDHNFCRNPDGETNIWCYTSQCGSQGPRRGGCADGLRWDYCAPTTEQPKQIKMYHHGGKNYYDLLQLVKQERPDLTQISLYGASGGGVAAVAWASVMADMWTDAEVYALADSALHVFPGTQIFDYFWEYSQYGLGPAANNVPHYTDVVVPDFDWRLPDALAKHVKSHGGRVKIAYIACMDDYVVYGDRSTMAVAAGLSDMLANLLNESTQHDRTWSFLNSLHACSADGSSYSVIMDCGSHHLTKIGEWDTDLLKVPGVNLSVKTFTKNFLNGLPPVPGVATDRFWYEAHGSQASDRCCSSPVRRRRGMKDGPDTVDKSNCPTPEPTTALPTQLPTSASPTGSPTLKPTTAAPSTVSPSSQPEDVSGATRLASFLHMIVPLVVLS